GLGDRGPATAGELRRPGRAAAGQRRDGGPRRAGRRRVVRGRPDAAAGPEPPGGRRATGRAAGSLTRCLPGTVLYMSSGGASGSTGVPRRRAAQGSRATTAPAVT